MSIGVAATSFPCPGRDHGGYFSKSPRLAWGSTHRDVEVRPLEGQTDSVERIVNKDPKGRIVPDIATSWKVSRDGKTVTFKLRKGLKFHSGRPLTSRAIKQVYDAIANPKSGSPLRSVLVPHVRTTLAPNPTTLVLKLAHPYYDVFNIVQTGYWAIVNTKTRNRVGPTNYGKKVIDS